MKVHIESVARAFGVFSGVFIATRWSANSKPTYDTMLMLFAAVLAVLLAR